MFDSELQPALVSPLSVKIDVEKMESQKPKLSRPPRAFAPTGLWRHFRLFALDGSLRSVDPLYKSALQRCPCFPLPMFQASGNVN